MCIRDSYNPDRRSPEYFAGPAVYLRVSYEYSGGGRCHSAVAAGLLRLCSAGASPETHAYSSLPSAAGRTAAWANYGPGLFPVPDPGDRQYHHHCYCLLYTSLHFIIAEIRKPLILLGGPLQILNNHLSRH